MMFDAPGRTHAASGDDDGGPFVFINGNGVIGARCIFEIGHVERVKPLIHNGPGLGIIVFFVFPENLGGFDGQRAVKIDRYLRQKTLPLKFSQDI